MIQAIVNSKKDMGWAKLLLIRGHDTNAIKSSIKRNYVNSISTSNTNRNNLKVRFMDEENTVSKPNKGTDNHTNSEEYKMPKHFGIDYANKLENT